MKCKLDLLSLLYKCNFIIFATSIFITQAHSASLQVAPILLEFSPQEKVKELWLTNTGNEAIQGQVRVNAWTQKNNQDVLSPSKDLIASPMVLVIPPGQRQLVRLIRMNTNDSSSSEKAYRLIVDELPNPQIKKPSGLELLVKYSIPVFFKSSSLDTTQQGITSLNNISFKYSTNTLTVSNQSQHYKRFSQFAYVDPQGHKIPIQTGLMGYVLSGQTMKWNIPAHIKVKPNGKFVSVVNMDIHAQELILSP
ncbi:fimbrial biogenesis chaperone [Acinetobacter baumannii]|uniref:fimbrial biogenesis chaperone n=1 Tax=Acinetobacter baumannii TaxID=470 RepID=UPI000D697982|nr:molecular chaperone [Acinetobacter baumannii]